jgi:hypothetical protein
MRVVWAGWCDAVIAWDGNQGSGEESKNRLGGVEEPRLWDIEYFGTGLLDTQKEWLIGHGDLKRAVATIGPCDRDCDGGEGVVLFGSTMHHGVRGYVVKRAKGADQKVVLFGTDVETQDLGVPDVQTYFLSETRAIVTDVKIDSEGCVLLHVKKRSATGESVLRFADFGLFRRYLEAGGGMHDGGAEVTLLPFTSQDPPRCVGNATTMTAVDDEGHVWTSTRDPRYSRCLGRSYDGDVEMALLPYLEECYVTKVASGGYMSAAVSSDGELFLWGQACPGSKHELDVLKGDAETGPSATGISCSGDQDEFVKCLDVRIDGHEATVYDVAIGHGHVLVAAEVVEAGRETQRVVFAAGDNSRNQLGLGADVDFKERFEEITCLRGKRIAQLAAAGWSTYVVSLDE